jgi:hypothetical protein
MVESKEEVLVKEERRLEAAPAAIPPDLPPATSCNLCFMFFVFLRRLSSSSLRGGVYI